MEIVFAADMHLKPGYNPGQNQKLKKFLELSSRYGRLILIGDTFNCWYEKNGEYIGDYAEIIDIFAAAIAHGLRIDLLSGNRDFVISKGIMTPEGDIFSGFTLPLQEKCSVLAQAGINLRGWVYRFEQDGLTYHCAHGDVYCIDNLWHQLLRYLIMGNPARLLSRFVPGWLVHQIFSILQAYSRDTNRNPHNIYEYLLLQDEALIPLVDAGVDHILCGHLHQHMSRVVIGSKRKGRLTVLPCWAAGEYGVLENIAIVIKKTSSS